MLKSCMALGAALLLISTSSYGNDKTSAKAAKAAPVPSLGSCVHGDSIRGRLVHGSSREVCYDSCKQFLSTAKPEALVQDCRFQPLGHAGIGELILAGRKPLVAIGTCITQDTVRGGGSYNGQTLAQCRSTCGNFYETAKPDAKVYDCRYLEIGKAEVIVLKGRSPIKPVEVGQCITQDTIRGGGQYFNYTREQCYDTCKTFLASAEPRAKVYDCRYLPNGKPEVVLIAGRGPVEQVDVKSVVYRCDTKRGAVHFGYNYSGSGYAYFGVVGDGINVDCRDRNAKLVQGGTRQSCVFYDDPNGRWSIMVPQSKVPETLVQGIANNWDCDNYRLQKGVTPAECKAQYNCERIDNKPAPAASCKATNLSLSFNSNQGYGLETYNCAGPMPETKSGVKNVWGAPASAGNMTGKQCRYGNMQGAHNHVLTSKSAGTCQHYCTLIADCGANGQWTNIRYTW